jgi:hypothetical protein
MSGQLHSPDAISLGKQPSVSNGSGGWMGITAHPDMVVKKTAPHVQPIASHFTELFQLIFSFSEINITSNHIQT